MLLISFLDTFFFFFLRKGFTFRLKLLFFSRGHWKAYHERMINNHAIYIYIYTHTHTHTKMAVAGVLIQVIVVENKCGLTWMICKRRHFLPLILLWTWLQSGPKGWWLWPVWQIRIIFPPRPQSFSNVYQEASSRGQGMCYSIVCKDVGKNFA